MAPEPRGEPSSRPFATASASPITLGTPPPPPLPGNDAPTFKAARNLLFVSWEGADLPWLLPAIERAIRTSDLDLNPQNDGKIIRIAIPPLTEQRRKELVKVVHKISEEYKVSVRNLRRDANELIKDIKKDGKISEDDAFKSQEKIQKITDEHISLVDACYKEKEKEILEF